ncbi:MAG: HAMP domain-containing protein [Prevotella sp.]|nr:HAMP domain-containing protein [Prevotella sp.]
MKQTSHIRPTLSTQITLWVVGFAALIFGVICYLMSHFSNVLLLSILTAFVSLVILLIICWWVISRHLHPLSLLAVSAQRIAQNNLDEELKNSSNKDEIGQLQNSFITMQHSLSDYISEMQQKRSTLLQQNDELQAAYKQVQDSDSIKSQFLSRMTEQMVQNVDAITELTDTLCDHYKELSKTDMMKIQIQMLSYTDEVTFLLDQMLNKPNTQEKPTTP